MFDTQTLNRDLVTFAKSKYTKSCHLGDCVFLIHCNIAEKELYV